MSEYRITWVETDIYDIIVEADSLEEAKSLAERGFGEEKIWDEASSYSDFGDDHYIFDTETGEWEPVDA